MNPIDEILDGLRLESSVFCRMTLSDEWGFAKDAVRGAPFHLMLSGRAWLRTGDDEAVPLGPGDIVILPRGQEHCLVSTPDAPTVPFRQIADDRGLPPCTPGKRYQAVDLRFGSGDLTAIVVSGVFAFEDPHQSPLLRALPSVLVMRAAVGSPLAAITALLDAELLSGKPGAETVGARLADILFIQAIRHHLASANALPRGWLRGIVDAEIAPVLTLIHRSPGRPWSVATLAREAGLSRSRFAARFHDVVGQTPLDYLTHWRMYRAAGRLAESRLSLATLAESVGYRSEVSFTKAFKRWSGRSPAQYRRALAQAASGGVEAEAMLAPLPAPPAARDDRFELMDAP